MPFDPIDRRTLKAQARTLLRSGRVPPLRLTLLYLAIQLLLNTISTALDGMTQQPAAIDPTTLDPGQYLDFFGSITVARTPLQWMVLFLGILITLILWVLRAGYYSYCLGVARGEVTPYESLFDGFSFAGKALALTVILIVLIGAGIAFFIVPGVVLALTYRFALYQLCHDPSIGVIEALRRSRLQTSGHRWDILLLGLSFWPQLLLLIAAEAVSVQYLSPFFSFTLVGDLCYLLAYSALNAAVCFYIMPYMELSRALLFLRLGAPQKQ